MKQCPKCHADIEDNARFCVFCMSALQEKETIVTKKEFDKRWLYIAAAFLLVVAVLLFAILSGNKKNNTDNGKNNSSLSGNTTSVNSDNNDTDNSDISDISDENSSNENSSSPVSTPENDDDNIEDGPGDNTPTITPSTPATPDDTDTPDTPNEPSTPTTPDTPNTPSTDNTDEEKDTETDTDTDTDSDDTSDTEQKPTTVTQATYSYRDALYTECYMYGNEPQNQFMENHIVITGVSGAVSDGVYEIPETINGKKVVAVMQSAFSDPSVSASVKKIILPSTLRSVWENAFSDCYNLTDIYFRSKSISVSELAFADVSKRTSKLTIHCSNDCKDAKYYYYRKIASTKYNAVYESWDGGAIE